MSKYKKRGGMSLEELRHVREVQGRANRKYRSKPEVAAKNRKRVRDWQKKNPDRVRENWFKLAYGITVGDYDLLLIRQNGVCAICRKPPAPGKRLHVDHCHKTEVIRGLLCSPCNTSIGMMRDDAALLRAAADYVEKYSSKPQGEKR